MVADHSGKGDFGGNNLPESNPSVHTEIAPVQLLNGGGGGGRGREGKPFHWNKEVSLGHVAVSG